ncbi:MAG: PIN domain-containing protein [Acidimicrobiia bacterium]|nr:PIN domain-containing protein [Acidimicrobiia bacterium]
MLLADTSAWIDYLKGSGSPHSMRLRSGIVEREVVVVDPVLLEVMAGARRDSVVQTQRLLEAQHVEALAPRIDWIDAATIYRELRWRGVTLRSQIDALIAAVAIRLDLPILHHDRDYGQIAQYTDLQVVRV